MKAFLIILFYIAPMLLVIFGIRKIIYDDLLRGIVILTL